jgi:hypothetical protein
MIPEPLKTLPASAINPPVEHCMYHPFKTVVKAMSISIPPAAAFSACLLLVGGWMQPCSAAEPASVKGVLTAESFRELHTLIRPHDNEWRHLRVGWLTDVVAARKKAAAEDKPLVICYTGGAGYNEPLGTC